jgi:hypothetical protein
MTGKLPSDEEEVQVTFVHSKDGKKKSIPIWFTLRGGKMELLPMYGTKSRWFMDVERSGIVELKVKDWKKTARPRTIRDMAALNGIKERFSEKYGAGQVKKYYPTCDAAFEVAL